MSAAGKATVTSHRSASGYVALGIVTTTAPRPRLLEAINALRPRIDVRLPIIADAHAVSGRTRYRVEVALPLASDAQYAIETWRIIKQTLLSGFGAERPDAIQIIET